jgi:IS30 family transposase
LVASAAIINLLKPYQRDPHTITYDKGKEYAHHEDVAKQLSADCYFANPYSSLERGLNENHNGLIRQYLPKQLPFDRVTDAKDVK